MNWVQYNSCFVLFNKNVYFYSDPLYNVNNYGRNDYKYSWYDIITICSPQYDIYLNIKMWCL